MPKRAAGAMHVATTRRHYKDRVYETHLLRRSFRDADGKPRNETLANLSHLPADTIELVRRSLKGEAFVAAGQTFDIARSRPHGHVAAVAAMARKLGLPSLLGAACAERDVAFALVIARACRPGSKLATVRWWADTTLAPDLDVDAVDTDDVYAAMDWLLHRQPAIEKTLAARHLTPGGLVLYDLSGSWVEGRTCPLAAHGYSRDGKRGKAQICYGLVTDADGRPVAVNVLPGNTADPTAFAATVDTVVERFGLDRVVMVGDRGMITAARIDDLRGRGGIDWITALRAPSIQKLTGQGGIQLSLFDQANLAEIASDDFPDERLVVCRNPLLAAERARKRADLGRHRRRTGPRRRRRGRGTAQRRRQDRPARRPRDQPLQDGQALHPRHRRRPLRLPPRPGRDRRRSCPRRRLRAAHQRVRGNAGQRRVVAAYKRLAAVERDFRSLKTVDLDIRPIHHRLEDRVRGHVLICMLAAYLVWHLRQTWAPLCFTDEAPPDRDDPVAPARRSHSAQRKASRRTTADQQPVHSFPTLLDHLATLTRDRVRFRDSGVEIDKLAQPTPTQRRAFELLDTPIPLKIN